MNPPKPPSASPAPQRGFEHIKQSLALLQPACEFEERRGELITEYLYSQDITQFTNATELLNHYCMQTFKVLPRYTFGQRARLGKWEVAVTLPAAGVNITAAAKTKKIAKNTAAMQILGHLGVGEFSQARRQKRITVPAILSADEVALLVVVENLQYQLPQDALLGCLMSNGCRVTSIVPRGTAHVVFPQLLGTEEEFEQLLVGKVGPQNMEKVGPYMYIVRKCTETNNLCTMDHWCSFFGGLQLTRFFVHGEAYVYCETRDDVQKALRANGTKLGDRRIEVHEAQQTGRSLEQGYVTVFGLHWDTTKEEVIEFCSNQRQWPVLSVCPRNEALVVFRSPEEAHAALEYFIRLQGQRNDGAKWRCEPHKKDTTGSTLFLRGIPFTFTSESQFREYFPTANEFRVRGEALVQYENWLHAKAALGWSKTKDLHGRIVHIKPARISRTPSPPLSPEQTPQAPPTPI